MVQVGDGFLVRLPSGSQVNLKVKGQDSEGDAVKAWHRMMAGDDPIKQKPKPTPKQEPKPEEKPAAPTVEGIVQAAS